MTAKDLDDCGMLIAIVIISMVFIIAMALMIGAFAYVIYMTWLVICLIALTRVVMAYMDPRTAHWIFVIPLIIITIIAGHIAFNATIYFEPVPHAYGNDFCMKGISQVDGTTTYTRADLWLQNTFIYVPFTKIKLYGTNVTYYPDRSQYGWHNEVQPYTVVSRNGVPMKVSLAWNLDIYNDSNNELEQLFYKRGPNWEINYAKSIVTQQMVTNLASTRSFRSLESPSGNDDANFLLKVKTDDFEGYIAIKYNIADTTFRDCYYQHVFDNTGPSSTDNRPIYGEPGQAPTNPADKCAPYDISNEDTSQLSTYYNTPSTISDTPIVTGKQIGRAHV